MQSNSWANITNHHGQSAQCQYYNFIAPRQWRVILVCPTPFLLTVSFKTPEKFHSLVGWQEFCFFVVNCSSWWSLYLSLALCVDHLSIIRTERRVQQCTNQILTHLFSDYVKIVYFDWNLLLYSYSFQLLSIHTLATRNQKARIISLCLVHLSFHRPITTLHSPVTK